MELFPGMLVELKKILTLYSIFLLFTVTAIVSISCEKDELGVSQQNVQFGLPAFGVVGETLLITCEAGDFDSYNWQISDGTYYETSTITHTFSKPGNYKILLTVYKNNHPVGSVAQFIDVFYNQRMYSSINGFYATRSFFAGHKIFIEGYFQDTENRATTYLVFDSELNCTDTLLPTDITDEDLSLVLEQENSYTQIKTSGVVELSLADLKPTTEFDAFLNGSLNREIINYSNGYLHWYTNSNSEFLVEYYDAGMQRLWTKTFIGNNTTGNKYVFNLTEKLYYLSFDKLADSVYIEKFKNVSLSYTKKALSLGCPAANRQVLFAYANPAKNCVILAVYNEVRKITTIYRIDENLCINTLRRYSGKLRACPITLQTDGAVITAESNKLSKYSSDWDLLAEKNIGHSDFIMDEIGANLYLLIENTTKGLRLSYFDKQLDDVYFD
jgi:hypothetical protein